MIATLEITSHNERFPLFVQEILKLPVRGDKRQLIARFLSLRWVAVRFQRFLEKQLAREASGKFR